MSRELEAKVEILTALVADLIDVVAGLRSRIDAATVAPDPTEPRPFRPQPNRDAVDRVRLAVRGLANGKHQSEIRLETGLDPLTIGALDQIFRPSLGMLRSLSGEEFNRAVRAVLRGKTRAA